jgi:putative methyltransferase (TIGR04325 family)
MNKSNQSVSTLARRIRHLVHETAELPGFRLIAKPAYRRWFQSEHNVVNAYCGVFDSYEEALAHAPKSRPNTYDVEDAAEMYRDRFDSIRVSDYPLVYWLSRLLAQGQRRIFDLGGHTGVSYYGFRRYLDYPSELRWLIHDTPAAIAAGKKQALVLDPERRLSFTARREDADGQEVLIASGVLQYLDYTLPEFLRCLAKAPPHVVVNLTPMHPSSGFVTLQHIGVAILPYRVMAVPEIVKAMDSLGYRIADRWESFERNLRVPFEPARDVDRYYGFYFRRDL